MAITKKEVYYAMKNILDDENFTKIDDSYYIKLNKKFTQDEIEGIICSIANLFGNKIIEAHSQEEINTNDFKFNSRYIDIDNDSIKIDKYGKLYVDLESDALVDALMANPEFVKKIADKITPDKISMDFVEKYLLEDDVFMAALKAKLA